MVGYRSDDFEPAAPRSEWVDRLDRLSAESASNSHDLPARSKKFPVLDFRESAAITAKRMGNLGPDSLTGARNRKSSPYFPCQKGIRPKDEFAPDSPHGPPGCGCRDLSHLSRSRPRNSRDSAESWPMGSCESEPETPGSGLTARHRALISVGELGGSDCPGSVSLFGETKCRSSNRRRCSRTHRSEKF